MELKKTQRGFEFAEFEDKYSSKCSLQKSSIATEDCIWFGIDDPNPVVMASDAKKLGMDVSQGTGWVEYDIPQEVHLTTRMHLTQEMVKNLLPHLIKFAETGEL